MTEHLDRDVLVVVGRPTFDLASAAPFVATAVEVCDQTTVVVADGRILQSPEDVVAAMASVPERVRNLVVLFASFADSRLASAAVDHFEQIGHVVLWSLPEEWTGGRLLRNSLCGANLAAYRLVAEGHTVATLHEPPGPATQRNIERSVRRADSRRATPTPTTAPSAELSDADAALVAEVVADIRGTTIGVIGDPPDGFEPCIANPNLLPAEVVVGHTSVERLFESAGRPLTVADEEEVSRLRDLVGNESIDRSAVQQCVALQRGAERLSEREGWNAVAIRCWPECFDQWGGAACAAMAMLNERGLPAACEADVLGALSMRMMQRVSGTPTFLADLVDAELDQDRVALWHCGVAPPSLAEEPGAVTVALHSNRQLPVVFDFGLAAGPITIARLSQSEGAMRLVTGQGHIVGQQPFQGTSCVVQLETSAETLLSEVVSGGLEHHFVVAPGHHQRLLDAVAAELGVPAVHLT